MTRASLHIGLHFVMPFILSVLIFRKRYFFPFVVMCTTMAVDLDHLLSIPIYDPDRCSIGFHPLHSYLAISIYPILLMFRKSRIFGIGILIHMLLDAVDCLFSRF